MVTLFSSYKVPIRMKIHPTALVDSKAELDESVEVHAYSIIGPHVRIGANTVIGPHVVIRGRTEIGPDNHIYSGAQIGVDSQDMKHDRNLVGRTVIGRGNILREYITISASTMTRADEEHRVTSIGDHCLLMAYSHVAHDCHVGSHVWMANCASLAGHVDVHDYAILGGLTGVHQECVVGTMAFVGGMTRVNQDAPPYMIIEGNPARCCGPNVVGLRRQGFDEDARKRIKQMYRTMFRSGLNTTHALQEIEASVKPCPERTHFLEFVRTSIRGITP